MQHSGPGPLSPQAHGPDGRGDGDGWVECTQGHRHWGRYGAAGLLLRHVDAAGQRWVLLQHRVEWSHHGGTWGLPGGARSSTETAVEAAVREADEEAGLEGAPLDVTAEYVADHGSWSYTTVIATTAVRVPARATGGESLEVRWVAENAVPELPLHPGLESAWGDLLKL